MQEVQNICLDVRTGTTERIPALCLSGIDEGLATDGADEMV